VVVGGVGVASTGEFGSTDAIIFKKYFSKWVCSTDKYYLTSSKKQNAEYRETDFSQPKLQRQHF
jgi:hypothetical protein